MSRAEWAKTRIATAIRPLVRVSEPPAMRTMWDVPVTVRDGTVLRANVFLPPEDSPVPAIMCAHPYGKDRIPKNTRNGKGINFQFRLIPQPDVIEISNLTNWEAPDPAFWVAHGYAVVNCDLRGGGTSGGTAELFSDQEAEDYYDLIEWVAAQPWCTSRVGLDGVSYLALSQYKVAALGPPHLAAICPWEGFSDLYRDFARPGGVREDGFTIIWSKGTRRGARVATDVRAEIVRHTELDHWYSARTPDVEKIKVPMLQCASFSDHSLHSRGSFEAFRRSGSTWKWLYTHRVGKWSHYYGAAATDERRRFFDHFLKGADNGWDNRPPVEVRVHEFGDAPVETIGANSWPPDDLEWRTLHLDGHRGEMRDQPAEQEATATFSTKSRPVEFVWKVPYDLDIIGPMSLEVPISLAGADDANVFVAVRKFHNGQEVGFEGSYGYRLDVVSRGWQRVAHRQLDARLSSPEQPVHRHDLVEPVRPGELVPTHIALLPHATRFRAGDELRVALGGRWFIPRDPLRGQFPAGYQRGPHVRCVVHTGPRMKAALYLGLRRLVGSNTNDTTASP